MHVDVRPHWHGQDQDHPKIPSRSCADFRSRHWHDDQTVVAMQMPAEQVERDVYGELLNAMNAPGPIGYTAFRLKAIRSPMRSMRVRMLVIDEVPAMLTGT